MNLLANTQRHVVILASMFFVFGAFWAFLAMWFLYTERGFELNSLGGAFIIAFTAAAIPLLAAGWGLLRLKPWARIYASALAAIALIALFPIGTPFGIYALWVLSAAGAKALFSDVTQHVQPDATTKPDPY